MLRSFACGCCFCFLKFVVVVAGPSCCFDVVAHAVIYLSLLLLPLELLFFGAGAIVVVTLLLFLSVVGTCGRCFG